MTTIATDGKTISADTMQQGGWIDRIDCVKLHRINGAVYSFSGNLADGLKYIAWVKIGKPKADTPDFNESFNVIWVKDGRVWSDNNDMMPVECGTPYALGSGGGYAMAAMMAGASPKKAVSIAMKLDPHTGGKIRTMKC